MKKFVEKNFVIIVLVIALLPSLKDVVTVENLLK